MKHYNFKIIAVLAMFGFNGIDAAQQQAQQPHVLPRTKWQTFNQYVGATIQPEKTNPREVYDYEGLHYEPYVYDEKQRKFGLNMHKYGVFTALTSALALLGYKASGKIKKRWVWDGVLGTFVHKDAPLSKARRAWFGLCCGFVGALCGGVYALSCEASLQRMHEAEMVAFRHEPFDYIEVKPAANNGLINMSALNNDYKYLYVRNYFSSRQKLPSTLSERNPWDHDERLLRERRRLARVYPEWLKDNRKRIQN